MVSKGLDTSESIDYTYMADLNPDGSKKSSSSEGKDTSKLSPQARMAQRLTYNQTQTFNPGTKYEFKTRAYWGSLASDKIGSGNSLKDVINSPWGTSLSTQDASMGGVSVDNYMFDRIILDDSRIQVMELPYIRKQNNKIVPDFAKLKLMTDADIKLRNAGLLDRDGNEKPNTQEQVNEIYKEVGLPPKYKKMNGQWVLNDDRFMSFAAFSGLVDESIGDGLDDSLIEDDNAEEFYQ